LRVYCDLTLNSPTQSYDIFRLLQRLGLLLRFARDQAGRPRRPSRPPQAPQGCLDGHASIRACACHRFRNQLTFKHSSRSFPLKLSTCAFSTALGNDGIQHSRYARTGEACIDLRPQALARKRVHHAEYTHSSAIGQPIVRSPVTTLGWEPSARSAAGRRAPVACAVCVSHSIPQRDKCGTAVYGSQSCPPSESSPTAGDNHSAASPAPARNPGGAGVKVRHQARGLEGAARSRA